MKPITQTLSRQGGYKALILVLNKLAVDFLPPASLICQQSHSSRFHTVSLTQVVFWTCISTCKERPASSCWSSIQHFFRSKWCRPWSLPPRKLCLDCESPHWIIDLFAVSSRWLSRESNSWRHCACALWRPTHRWDCLWFQLWSGHPSQLQPRERTSHSRSVYLCFWHETFLLIIKHPSIMLLFGPSCADFRSNPCSVALDFHLFLSMCIAQEIHYLRISQMHSLRDCTNSLAVAAIDVSK